MKRRFRVCVLVLALACASGCSTVYGPASLGYQFEAGRKEGVIILSFKQPEYPYAFICRTLDTKKNCCNVLVENKRSGATPWSFWSEISTGSGMVFFEDKCVTAYRLPEGEYEFFNWVEDRSTSYAIYKLYSKKDFSIPFKVVAGKAVYAGRLERVELGKDKYMLKVSDERGEDLAVVKKCYRNIPDEVIDVRVLGEQSKGIFIGK